VIYDEFKVSWAWWQFKSFNDITTQGEGTSESFYDENGDLQIKKVRALSRTYAYAVAGTIIDMNFDSSNGIFNLSFNYDKSITQPTEIYLNKEFYYPNGYKLITTPTQAVSWKEVELNRIHINVQPISDGKIIKITIMPI